MKNKIISIFLCFFLMASIFVSAGNIDNPEISDISEDAFGYLDIDSVWFYEDSNIPELLFISMKINDPSLKKFQQTFAVFWKYNDVEYACSLHLGFGIKQDWQQYNAGESNRNSTDRWSKNYRINGTYSSLDGIITWEIPKNIIGNPKKDDILYNTWSNAFRRLGFLGRIGFSRPILNNLIYQYFGNSLYDYAPDEGYGLNYIIEY